MIDISNKLKYLKEFIGNCKRTILVARKPTFKEFTDATRICAIGLIMIGLMGFFFYIVSILLGV